MIKASGTATDGRRWLFLGLSFDNLDRLRAGQPVRFPGETYGFSGEILIFAGETEATMTAALQEGNPGLQPQADPYPT